MLKVRVYLKFYLNNQRFLLFVYFLEARWQGYVKGGSLASPSLACRAKVEGWLRPRRGFQVCSRIFSLWEGCQYGVCERVKTRHMGLRTALTHGSVLHAGVQGTEVCSPPRRMEVCSTPSCWTPRVAPEWKCTPHSAAIGVVWCA